MLNTEAIFAAQKRHRATPQGVWATPTLFSPQLSALTGGNVFFKCEHMQHGGSFKLRGALNKLLCVREANRNVREVVAASSGNHGIATSIAGRVANIDTTIYLPGKVAKTKLDTIEQLGGTPLLVEGDALQAELEARAYAEETGLTYISPYNDPEVIAGQGTIGLEILADCPDVDVILSAVGGGGLASGIGTAVKAVKPATQLIGIWPEVARSMYECLNRGEIVNVDESPTLSDGTAGGVEPGAITFSFLGRLLDEKRLISEAHIRSAMRWLFEVEHWVVEGAGALPVAALMETPQAFANKTVVLILCGKNVDSARFLQAIDGA